MNRFLRAVRGRALRPEGLLDVLEDWRDLPPRSRLFLAKLTSLGVQMSREVGSGGGALLRPALRLVFEVLGVPVGFEEPHDRSGGWREIYSSRPSSCMHSSLHA